MCWPRTKLHMPASRPGQVLRPRLTARLDEGLAGGSSWPPPRPDTARRSCSPTGPGAGEHPVAWLSLDGGDNDPAPVLVSRGGRAGPGPSGDRRTGGSVARPASADVVPGPGHGADQRSGRGAGPARPRRLPRDQRAAGARVALVPGRAPACRGSAWYWPAATRSPAVAGAAAGTRPADRDTRGRAAVHARGGREAAPARGVGSAGCVGGGAGGPDRRLGGRAGAGRAVTARPG